MAVNVSKNDKKLIKMTQNGQKWPKNDLKWAKIDQM